MTFAEALAALDCAVTSVSHSRAYLTQQAQQWMVKGDHGLDRFASGHEAYALSDGGRSQVKYSIADGWCALTCNASSEARDNFEAALTERRAIEALVAAWLDGKRTHCEAVSPM